ncbi:molybdopterin synthase sulfur carrier subunit [Nocardioides sp. Soil774]|uniref:MoaD/ThiS family protein n=1 Tax=Nocardioides sp. Soil774 TaxID=1736408 RepID=UPI0006F348E6|nr:MoaD/ThiS family protein [Nocardioides sp. Soil774]KRE97254.1 molybdopterin synthase sulfur carrier subunit [Nocardioides sp. Soil774]
MSAAPGADQARETVTVRYWAGARAAAGTAEDVFEVGGDVTLAEVVRRVLERHPDDRTARTIAVCSVLVGDRPVRSQDPAAVTISPGSVVEMLPPFAGG